MILGIDLGTTTTEAAIYKDGNVVMIPDEDGAVVTPSVVGLDEKGQFVVGEPARAQFLMAPERTAVEIKRKFGTGEWVSLGKKTFSVQELSAKILTKVKQNAEEFLSQEITQAVISVPAYFDETQRQQVIEAGRLSGFEVKRIINEPTAAAMSYGISHIEEESHVLVYDLGGGTFDVTLLEMFGGVLEVKASSGDNQLGGKDFDECLSTYLREEFERENHISLKKDIYALARLKDAAQQCKIVLSTEESYEVQLPMLANKNGIPLALSQTVTRAQFEQMTGELLLRTHHPIDVVLEDAGVSASDIDLILLVGGSTRMPMVARDIEEYLGQPPKSEIDPDYSVAQGAAIQAAILEDRLEGENPLVVTDVNPYSLGVRCLNYFDNDFMKVIIPRNVTIPVTKKDVFYTSDDYVTHVVIEVYQGEERQASKNHFLGKFTLSGIPPKKQGKERLLVSFSYNLNGMLNVSATVESTGNKAGIELNLTNADVDGSMERDVSGWKKYELSSDYRSLIRRAEKRIEREEDPDICEDLEEIVYELKCAIIDGDRMEAEGLKLEIEEIL